MSFTFVSSCLFVLFYPDCFFIYSYFLFTYVYCLVSAFNLMLFWVKTFFPAGRKTTIIYRKQSFGPKLGHQKSELYNIVDIHYLYTDIWIYIPYTFYTF